MKTCPACTRTYADDTLAFCLDDGALLSAPFDSQTTLQIPAARDTEPPPTEILNPQPEPGSQRPQPPPPQPPSAPRVFNYPQGAATAAPLPQKRGGKVAGLVIAILSVGVLVLGYIALRGNQGASSEPSKGDGNVQANSPTPTPTVNTNVNVNSGGGSKPLGDPRPLWLEGEWEGTGQQKAPKMTWTIKLTAENNAYEVEYPSLRCGGKWTLVESGEDRAQFKETITRGLDRCSSDGDILVEKISDYEISYKYTLPIIGEVATAKLTKGAAR